MLGGSYETMLGEVRLLAPSTPFPPWLSFIATAQANGTSTTSRLGIRRVSCNDQYS